MNILTKYNITVDIRTKINAIFYLNKSHKAALSARSSCRQSELFTSHFRVTTVTQSMV